MENIKTLRGLIPIGAACKKIRDDKGFWHQVETYIKSHSAAEFTHSICPDCTQELYPEFQKIGESRPTLAQFRRRLVPKREFLQLLCYRDHPLISASTKILLRDVYDHTIRMQEVLDVARDILAGVQSNYLAQVSNRMNEVMKTLSIVATIMLPLSLVTGLFGINVHVPGQEAEGNYWFFGIVFSMMVMTISMIVYFRRRRWF